MEQYDYLEELIDQSGLELIEVRYSCPKKQLTGVINRLGAVKVQGNLEQMQDFLVRLENKGWIFGSAGRCYAKKNILVFDFELQHLCRPSHEAYE